MNYYCPRQRENDKRWDYTCKNDKQVFAVGYCRPYQDLENHPYIWVSAERLAQDRALAHKHHDHGHETAQEAADCYREYLLDNHLRVEEEHDGVQFPCVVCGTWTSKFARVNWSMWDLCDDHRNRTEVEKLFTVSATGMTISST